MRTYDLIIIGSGPGGYVAALYASRFKKSVCVIERSDLGGTCLNRGCIPTKAMIHSASLLSRIKGSKEYGIEVSDVTVNFPVIAARKDSIVTRLRAGIETLFKANKIDLIKGEAVLAPTGAAGPISQVGVVVNGENYNARDIIIAVGSRPMEIPGVKIDEKRIYSSDGILNLKEIPEKLTIAGGGVIGCEFAALFNALGSKVTIVELVDRILPGQSKEVSRKMETIFKKRGVEVHTSTELSLRGSEAT
ncbi:MAG: FAD-dependent oxidoreductase, partial [Candidatus Omnitrophota bacterium]|nr:FAD-dependent oxidoreductase [Candidatus Omnitrophota bacterium]